MYLLDTDICIYFTNATHPGVRARMLSTPSEDLGTTTITAAELLFGAAHSARPSEDLGTAETFLRSIKVVQFSLDAARHYARIRQNLGQRGQLIGEMDLLIAATTLAENATLVTNNVSEFSRVDGLQLENWAE